MNQEKQRIAIAEACGFTEIKQQTVEEVDTECRSIISWEGLFGRRNGALECVPNYLNDLNAMHEAEGTLSDRDDKWQCRTYANVLETVMLRYNGLYPSKFGLLRATAAQRAEAFLKTIGKWEEH